VNAVEIRALSHNYGDRRALDNVELDVKKGEIFGLLGPNGGGKTTLFRILSTLLQPSSGSAKVCGHDPVTEATDVRRQIGVVFQSPSLDLKLTARENLKHQGDLYGVADPARAEAMLERVGLADRADEYCEGFSGGMRRRVDLAKGMLHEPRLLLLDEPSTGLDPGARRDLWLHLEYLRREEGVTSFLTTHLMEEAEKCDRLALLDQDATALQRDLLEKFELEGQLIDGTLRIEKEEGHRFVPQLIDAFPERITSVSIGKPTLEDVFVQLTGHRFWNEEEEA
jgi:ABC-2 type transport system ATP-binding protein